MQVIVVVALMATMFLTSRSQSAEAQLIILSSDQERIFQGEVVEDMVVLDALNASARAGNIPLSFSIDEVRDATIITQLDGHDAGDTIRFFINSNLIDGHKIHSIPLRSGDVITVKIF